jgi:hypothetical protein
MLEVTSRLPLSDATNRFVEWMNRQGIQRKATGAIGPRALLCFLAAWCKDNKQPLAQVFAQSQDPDFTEEFINLAIGFLEQNQMPSGVSGFAYLTQESEEVLIEAQNLVSALRRDQIEPHHLFASLLLRAAKEQNPDAFLGFTPGRVQQLVAAFLKLVKDGVYGEAWDYWNQAFVGVIIGAALSQEDQRTQKTGQSDSPKTKKVDGAARRKPVEAPFSKEAAKIPDSAANCIVVISPAGIDERRETGVGCVISRNHILTSRRVVQNAQPFTGEITEGMVVQVRLPWSPEHPPLQTKLIRLATGQSPADDLVLLESLEPLPRILVPAEFATMRSFTGKKISAIGFPDEYQNGTTAPGRFSGIELNGDLLRLESDVIEKLGGFGGTPLWSPNLRAFVGLVSGTDRRIALSASLLCKFYPELGVQFKIPQSDIPKINDYDVDDPNVELFGRSSESNGCRLTATMEKRADYFEVKATYECRRDSPPRGRFVTFITYPDFEREDYQIVKELDAEGKATAEFFPTVPDFTIAAIGDGGDTRLTLNLETLSKAAPQESAPRRQKPGDQKPGVPKAPMETSEVGQPPAGSKKAVGESDANQESAGQDAVPNGYTFGPVGFNSEFCGLGGNGNVEDKLHVEEFAIRLAELIALRETKLPVAVGLFGNWGSGKSYFMNLIDKHLKKLSEETPEDWAKRAAKPNAPLLPDPESKGPWCWEIVPVYFNAWHYVDTNLWASLVSQIFESLFGHLKPKVDELQKVQQLLEQASGATARAAEDLEIAKHEATKAQAELSAAKTAREQQETVVEGMLQGLITLLPDIRDVEARKNAARVLGVEQELQTFDELQKVVADAKTTAGRTKTFWNSFWGRGWTWRIGWLVVGVAASYFGPKLLMHADWFKAGREYLAEIFAAVAPVLSLITVAITKAKAALTKMEGWEAKAREAQQRRLQEDPEVKKAEENAQVAKKREQAALQRVAEAEARQKQLKEEALNLTPERRISRFIEQRAQSSDYRGQLGLVSLARRDFEELSNLFADEKALKQWLAALKKVEEEAEAESSEAEAEAVKASAEKKVAEAAAAKARSERKKTEAAAAKTEAEQLQKVSNSIDRIVLFVDDLDRCQPEKVVDVLQAIHLLLAFPLFSVVVGVDQRCLRQSLREQFKGLLTPDQQNVANGNHAVLADNGEQPATPLDYLEKIFHIPFHLPPMEKQGFEDLITNLTKPREETSTGSKETEIEALPEQKSENAVEKETVLATPDVAAMPKEHRTTPAGFESEFVDMSAGKPSGEKPTVAAPPVTPGDKPAQESFKVAEVVGSVPLLDWERTALKVYHPLIKTPRGTTRLLNTYRLVRAGISEGEDWKVFCGDEKVSGDFRLAMLLLAASAGCPAVARDWFTALRPTDQDKSLNPRELPGSPSKEWIDFKKMYTATKEGLNPKLNEDRLKTWLNRVERFTF